MTLSFRHIVYSRKIDEKITLPTLYRFSRRKMTHGLFHSSLQLQTFCLKFKQFSLVTKKSEAKIDIFKVKKLIYKL